MRTGADRAARRGRVDLAVEVDGSEQMLVITEIEATAWDTISPARPAANLRRHLRQLQACLYTAVEEMAVREWPGGVGAPLYLLALPAP